MKNLLLLSTIIFSYTILSAQCIDPALINPNGICTLQFEPVCGCDGKTYSNPCFAQIQGGVTSYKQGACPITESYSICAGNNVQIGLPGNIGNTIMSWSPTTDLSCTNCPNPFASPSSTTIYELAIFTTLSFSTSYSYYEVIVDQNCPCICLAIYDPVCGSNGVTYSNSCYAACDGITEYVNGECSEVCEPGPPFIAEYTGSIGTDDIPQSASSDIYCFQSNILTANVCSSFWDFGNGITSTESNPCDITFATLSNGLPVTEPYEVCLTVFDCNNANLGTCCETFVPQSFSSCFLAPDIGPCDGICPRWHYDKNTQDCVQFDWGCCGGNDNNFTSYEACISACDCYDPTLLDFEIFCTADYTPVCGCDGNTYSNACVATYGHGISSYTLGECGCDYNSWYQEPVCNTCVESVQIIQYNGTQYVAFWGDNSNCADAITTVYNCDGTEFCYEGGFAGFTQCSDNGLIGNYTVTNTLWTNSDCISCDYEDWISLPTCDDCVASVELIEFNGTSYVASWQSNYTGNGAVCSDQITTVYNCDGTVFCYEGGFAGFTQCSSIGLINNYTTTEVLWNQHTICGVCALPPDPGLCLAYFPRWHYSTLSDTCELFIWGGCGGNANNFTTYEACINACSSFECPAILNLGDNQLMSGMYEAEQTTITHGNVMAGEDVVLKAGLNVELKNGFTVPRNCNVKIDIDPCE